jgi:hypothetical protein
MNIRHVVALAFAWAISLVGVGLWAQGGTQKPGIAVQTGEPYGEIITGENIGFQHVAGQRDREGRVAGRLMVRINGEWFETVPPIRIVR